MKQVVTQITGCLNVLSRLKNSGMRIIQPMVAESLCPKFSALCQFTLRVPFPSGAPEERCRTEQGSTTFRYCDDFTAQFSELVNFEQFGRFLAKETRDGLLRGIAPD